MAIMNKKTEKNLLGITFRGSKNETVNYLQRSTIKLDKNGVLIYKIPYTDKYDYYPIFMARYSLGNLELFLDTKDEKYKKEFFTQTDWLLKNLVFKNNFAVWEHNYKLPFYDFKTPWVHGLGQGLGMIALLKAYQITGKNDYLKASEKVYNSFEVDISEGGVRYIDENDDIWLEEYALSPPPHVLNGFITILFGIHEFQKVTKKEKPKNLWDKGIKTLKNNLEKYEAGYWSIYDLLGKYPSTLSYHELHVRQLNILHNLTGEKIFLDYAKSWEKYMNKWINKKHANISRGMLHIKRYGIKNSIGRYIDRKKWQKQKTERG